MQVDDRAATELSRGTTKRRRSRCVVQFNGFALLLMICMFLPVARGCNGQVRYPIEDMHLGASFDLDDLLILATYTHAMLTGVIICISAVSASRLFWWRAFQIELTLCLLFVGLACLGEWWKSGFDLRRMLEGLLRFIVPLGLAIAWIVRALRSGQQQTAWARYQYCWLIISLIVVHLLCLFGQAHLGYYVSVAAILGLAFSTNLCARRMPHDLWDADAQVVPFQFTMGQIFFWMTAIPLAIGYLQLVNKFLDWVYAG